MLKIVDPELDGLTTCHRSQMSSDGQAEAMRLVDDRSQRVLRNLLIRLERCEAFRGPVTDGPARILWIANDLVCEEASLPSPLKKGLVRCISGPGTSPTVDSTF